MRWIHATLAMCLCGCAPSPMAGAAAVAADGALGTDDAGLLPVADAPAPGDDLAQGADAPLDDAIADVPVEVAAQPAPLDAEPDTAQDDSGTAADVAAEDPPDATGADIAPLPAAPTGCDAVYLGGAPTGTCATFTETWACPGAQFTSAVALPDGTFALAGGLQGQAWLVRVDALGKVLGQQVFADLGMANAVTVTQDGGLVLVGIGSPQWNPPPESAPELGAYWTQDQSQGWMLRLDAQGSKVWSKSWAPGPPPGFGLPSFVVALADGGFGIAGRRMDGTASWSSNALQWFAWVLRTDASGGTVWSQTYPDICGGTCITSGGWSSSRTVGFAALPDGGFLFGQYEGMPMNGSSRSLVRLDGSGAVVWAKNVYGGGVTMLPEGGLIACGDFGTMGGPSLSRLDDAGEFVWSTSLVGWDPYGWSGDAYAQALAITSDLEIAVALPGYGNLSGGGAARQLALLSAAAGTVHWQRPTNGITLVSLVSMADGGLIGGGMGKGGAVLMRTDRWGNTSCADSVACAGKAAGSCDDGNPCTSDLCGQGGCVHAGLVDFTGCGVGKQCLAGVCGP